MVATDYDLIVIGGGSGGLTAAIGGAGIGAKTLLIEKHKLGGDCTHHGCVPSKTLIKAARLAKQIRHHEKYGLKIKGKFKAEFDLDAALKKVQKTVKSIADHETPEEMKKYNIDTIIGSPKFIDEKTVEVDGKRFTSKRFVLSTGSRARVPDIKGINKVHYMTNKHVFDPRTFKSLAVVGAGPIGTELGQAFLELGVKVDLINNRETIMGREDTEASTFVEKILTEEGMIVHNNKRVLEVKEKGSQKVVIYEDQKTKQKSQVVVDQILVATGRVPNVEGLDLECAGIEYSGRGITVNAKGQSTNKRVYAVGDVAGGMQFTHLANAHAKAALSNLIFKIGAKYETEVIPRVTFTTPEVASVGISEDQAKEEGIQHTIIKKDFKEIDRAITDSNTQGFFKFILDKKGYILGAVLVGEGSGELIGEVSLAMKNKVSIGQLASTIHPYPTYGYGLRHTADLFRAQGYTEKKRKLVQRIFGLRGK